MTFVCEKCDANFTKKYNLSRHQSTHHQQNNVDNRFECNECNRKFNRKDILIRHIEILLKYKRDSFKCSQCSNIFSNKYSQAQHIRIAHIKNIKKKSYKDCKFRSCLNKINTQNPLAAAVFHKHSSTESKINSINVQSNDAEWKNIYIGTLGPRIRNLKIVSFMTSAVGLCIQPMVIQKAAEVGSSLAATIGVCTIAGFFTFITPVLIHMVTRKYVTSIEYNKKNDEYNATIISFFLKPKKVQFKPFEVRLPLTQKLTITFYAKKYPLFVDPQAFDDVMHYQRILGYDKPFTFEKEDNVLKKPVVKAANKS